MELERLDKIKGLVIVALVSDNELMETLVLIGGNAISIAYGIGNRGSSDIDFSMAESLRTWPPRLPKSKPPCSASSPKKAYTFSRCVGNTARTIRIT